MLRPPMFAASLAALVFASSAPAEMADFIIVPPSLENSQGGLGGTTPFAFPTTTGIRTQIVYDASLFSAVAGPQLITAIQFRPIDPTGGFFGDTLNVSNVTLRLSTTARSDENRNPLSATFADNIGADVTTVYSGPLSLTTSSTMLPNGTRAFDYIIPLQNSFVYNPAAGNLLLDTNVPTGERVRGNAFFGSFPRFDTTSRIDDGIYSVINTTSGDATTGRLASSGPVTRFAVSEVRAVPAPTSITLMIVAAACLLMVRYRRQRAEGNLMETHIA